jgi:hypothetical protein
VPFTVVARTACSPAYAGNGDNVLLAYDSIIQAAVDRIGLMYACADRPIKKSCIILIDYVGLL